MVIDDSASTLGELTADMTRYLMHGCNDVGEIEDRNGVAQIFDVNDPCFLLAVGDDEFAVVSQSGHHAPQIVVFYVDVSDPDRIGDAVRADATEHNMARVLNDLETVQEVAWEELDEFESGDLPATFTELVAMQDGYLSY